jgi:hypothetical protein
MRQQGYLPVITLFISSLQCNNDVPGSRRPQRQLSLKTAPCRKPAKPMLRICRTRIAPD